MWASALPWFAGGTECWKVFRHPASREHLPLWTDAKASGAGRCISWF
jgi:hypothetical protein